MGWRHELDGRPLHYHGNVTIQKAVFFLCGIGWVAVLRLFWGVWQVKRPRQKLLLAGLAIILVVLIEYVFSAMSLEQGFPQYEPAFRQVVGFFRELTYPKFINRAPKRLALVKADGSATLQAIFKKAGMPETAAAQFAVMNGMELGAVPSAGKLVKVVK